MQVQGWIGRVADAAGGAVEGVEATLRAAIRAPSVGASFGFEGVLCSRLLYRSPSLTVTAHRWPAGTRVPPHDHRMPSVVGVVSGTEHHRIGEARIAVPAGEVLGLSADVVHALETEAPTEAVHVYLGDLWAAERTTWDPVTGAPAPLRPEVLARMEQAFHERSLRDPVPPSRVQQVLQDLIAELRAAPPTPILRTPSGVAYDDVGAGPAIVFVHGLTYGRAAWAAVTARLPGFRCVALDLPGHGDSPDTLGLGTDDAVAAIRAVVEAAGLVDPVLVGHSAGAVLATRYASAHPVRGIVWVDQPLMVGRFAEMIRAKAADLRGPAFAAAWEPFERSMGYDALTPSVRSALLQTHHVRQEVVLGAWAILLDGAVAEVEADMDAWLRALKVPAWSIHGASLPPYAAWLRARVPHAEVEFWPDHGHFPQLADPDRFAAGLARFVSGS